MGETLRRLLERTQELEKQVGPGHKALQERAELLQQEKETLTRLMDYQLTRQKELGGVGSFGGGRASLIRASEANIATQTNTVRSTLVFRTPDAQFGAHLRPTRSNLRRTTTEDHCRTSLLR